MAKAGAKKIKATTYQNNFQEALQLQRKNKNARGASARKAPFAWRKLFANLYRVILVLALMALAYAMFYAVRAYQLEHTLIKSVELKSERKISDDEQIAKIVKSFVSGGLMTLDIKSARTRLMQLGWVKEVNIRKQWPDKLVVNIKEYQAVAKWQGVDSQNEFISREGVRFVGNSAEQYRNLPILEGGENSLERMIEAYQQLVPILANAALHVAKLKLEMRDEWQLTTVSGLQIKFLERDHKIALQHLQTALEVLRPKLDEIAIIDLRYSNGFAVQPKENINE